MSSLSTKVRPTFTLAEMRLLAQGMELLLNRHIQAGDFNNPILLDMIRIKDYCGGFVPAVSKANEQSKLAAYIQMQGIETSIPQGTAIIQPLETGSIELTDDQRYDLLKLRDESTYSDEDKVFMLNVGTLIMMRRAGINTVTESDL
jgi:hypothetical protein